MNNLNLINTNSIQIDLNAVDEMQFASIEKSEFFVAYKSLYSFEWTELITLYIIAEALCFLWENFIILVILNLFLYLYCINVRRFMILKIKNYPLFINITNSMAVAAILEIKVSGNIICTTMVPITTTKAISKSLTLLLAI